MAMDINGTQASGPVHGTALDNATAAWLPTSLVEEIEPNLEPPPLPARGFGHDSTGR